MNKMPLIFACICLSLAFFNQNALANSSAKDSETVKSLATDLQDYIDIYTLAGDVGEFKTKNSMSFEMVKEYLKSAYGHKGGVPLTDEELRDEFPDLVKWYKGGIYEAYGTAGTLDKDNLILELANVFETTKGLEGLSPEDPEEAKEINEYVQEGLKIINKLKKKKGVYFGFDGSAQNACGDNTGHLLILDTKSKMVYVIELEPCRES